MSVKENWDMECPKCRSDENLVIGILTAALLTPDGTDIWEYDSDHEWDDKSTCECAGCGHSGKVSEFELA